MHRPFGDLGKKLTGVVVVIASLVTLGATVSAGPGEPAETSTSSVPAPTTAPPTTGVFDSPIPVDGLDPGSRPGSTLQTQTPPPPPTTTTLPPPPPPPPADALPANSGSGRRAVYSKSRQRVWAVDSDGTILKTHRVSGRLKSCDPTPGTYSVFSRSRFTNNIQNPTIKWGYMVRFTKGCNGDNIGFHQIPTQYGRPVQSESQLGQPLSSGCVRQATSDAIWMWNWAYIGTTVVVLP